MRTKIFTVVVLAGAAFASECTSCGNAAPPCMTFAQAQAVASGYGILISNYSQTLANNLLSVNYIDYGESVNSLINSCPTGADAGQIPLLAPDATSRAQFEQGQAAQAQNNFQQLDIWHTCNTVSFRWMTTNVGAPKLANPKPVVGLITALVTSSNSTSYPWVVSEIYGEFDSAAWLQNLQAAGFCNSTTSKRSPRH